MGVVGAYQDRVKAGGLSHDPAQLDAAQRLDELEQAVSSWRPSIGDRLTGKGGPGERGLYIWGGVGRGKSMLMDLMFDVAAIKKKKRVHFHAFMLGVHSAVAELRKRQASDPLEKVAKAIADDAALLCFDELQVTDIGDAMIVGRLFEELFDRGVTIVATSNRPPQDLYKDGINRQLFTPFINLIEARMDVLNLDAERDYRFERLSGAPVWFTPLGDGAAFEAAWARLIGLEEERAETLHVQGRTLIADRAAGGAARFTFDALCGRALGAADYLALAHRFHTLALEAIPRLTPAKRNEAKRFVTLIDALYETKTKLIASAEAEADALYREGDGAFEFERTSSRLMEMRSEEYLAAERIAHIAAE